MGIGALAGAEGAVIDDVAISSSSELEEPSASMMVCKWPGTKGAASARKRCPDRVTPSDGRWVARTSVAESRGEDATEGATGRGGSTVMLSGVAGGDATVGAAVGCVADTALVLITCALYRKGLGAIVPAVGEDCSGALSARSGLMGRHSSSKVTERLEITVLVEGKYTIHA